MSNQNEIDQVSYTHTHTCTHARMHTHMHMDGWVGDIGEEGKKGQVEKADSHRTKCG